MSKLRNLTSWLVTLTYIYSSTFGPYISMASAQDFQGSEDISVAGGNDDLFTGASDFQGTAAAQDVADEAPRAAQVAGGDSGLANGDGSFGYSVPLEVPPGIAGLTPGLSLSYSSSSKYSDIVGVGWALGAESCINRVGPKQIDSQGHHIYRNGAPTFTPADVFLLDGNPLLRCEDSFAGASTSCPSGTYRTQHNDFSLVERSPNSSLSWRITKPDGTILTYRPQFETNTSPSGVNIEPNSDFNLIGKFCLVNVQHGNQQINYVYRAIGQQRLWKIQYGVASRISEVTFNYENRPDVTEGYSFGTYQIRNKRLESISTSIGGSSNRLRKYKFVYELSPDTHKSRLKKVLTFGKTDTDTLPAHVFTYKDSGAPTFDLPAVDQAPLPVAGLDVNNVLETNGLSYEPFPGESRIVQPKQYGLEFADLDSDGAPDLIQHRTDRPTMIWMNKLKSNQGFVRDTVRESKFKTSTTLPVPFLVDFYRQQVPGAPPGTLYDMTVSKSVKLVDLNGDGYTDFVQAFAPDVPVTTGYAFRVGIWNNTLQKFEESTTDVSKGAGFLAALNNSDDRKKITFNLFHRGAGAPHFTSLDAGTRLADVNGDNLPDIIISRLGFGTDAWNNTRQEVWINTGSSFVQAPAGTWQLPVYFTKLGDRPAGVGWGGSLAADMGVTLSDVNGDGLPDLVQALVDVLGSSYTTTKVWLNTGRGWLPAANWEASLSVHRLSWYVNRLVASLTPTFFWVSSNTGNGSVLLDVNGDGLPDLVKSHCTAVTSTSRVCDDVKTFLNNGLGWDSVDSPAHHIPGAIVRGDEDGGEIIMDMNGDGATDILLHRNYNYLNGSSVVLSDPQTIFVPQTRNTMEIDTLKSIVTPLGGTINVDYQISTTNHSPILVVRSITSSNGITAPSPASHVSTTDFFFKAPAVDLIHGQFIGFGLKETRQQLENGHDSWISTWINTNTSPTTRCNLGAVTAQIKHRYDGMLPNNQYPVPQDFGVYSASHYTYKPCLDGEVGPFFSQLTSVQNNIYDRTVNADVSKATKETYTYDSYGNLTETNSFEDASDVVPTRKSVTTFITPTLDKWKPDRACKSENFNSAGQLVRRSEVRYDGSLVTCGAISADGLPTFSAQIGFNSVGLEDSRLSSTMTYTADGNVATVTDARGTGYTSRFFYNDPLFPGLFVSRITDALNRVTDITYTPFGEARTTRNHSGVVTTTDYDGLGRVSNTVTTTPDGALAPSSSVLYENLGDPNNQKITQFTTLDSSVNPNIILTSESHLDGFGRQYLGVTRGASTNIAKSTGYNIEGLVSLATIDYPGDSFDLNQTATRFEYDDLGRTVKVTSPGGYVSTTSYKIYTGAAKNQIWNTVTDANGAIKHYLADGLGRSVQITECLTTTCPSPAPSSTTEVTSYTYDDTDNLLSVIMADSATGVGSRIRNFYDGLGRNIAIKDGDLSNFRDADVDNINSGCPWKYTYDSVGNLATQTDCKWIAYPTTGDIGYKTELTHDALNRLITKKVTASNGNIDLYSFIHDTTQFPAETDYPLGKPTKAMVSYANGDIIVEKFRFDSLGRNLSTVTDVNIVSDATFAGLGSRSARVDQTHNNGSQIRSITLPNNGLTETVSLVRNELGLVNSISKLRIGGVAKTLITGITYDALGRETTRSLGNGVTTRFNYNTGAGTTVAGDQRLASIVTSKAATTLMNHAISTDPAGNVLRVTSTSNKSPASFNYDKLSRLSNVYNSSGALLESFVYDALGNRVSTLTEQQSSGGSGGGRGIVPVLGGETSRNGSSGATSSIAMTSSSTSSVSNGIYGQAFSGIAGPHAIRCLGSENCTTNLTQVFSYDANGNLRTKINYANGSPTSFSYNSDNKVTRISDGTTTTKYFYNAFGHKVATNDAGNISFFFDPMYQTENGQEIRNYFIDGEVFATEKGTLPTPTLTYLGRDHLGSLRMVTDSVGTKLGAIDYDSFGRVINRSGGSSLMCDAFNGLKQDSTGHLDNVARTYSPDMRQFAQPDSVTPDLFRPQSLNRYAYTEQNPLSFVDPSGHDPQEPWNDNDHYRENMWWAKYGIPELPEVVVYAWSRSGWLGHGGPGGRPAGWGANGSAGASGPWGGGLGTGGVWAAVGAAALEGFTIAGITLTAEVTVPLALAAALASNKKVQNAGKKVGDELTAAAVGVVLAGTAAVVQAANKAEDATEDEEEDTNASPTPEDTQKENSPSDGEGARSTTMRGPERNRGLDGLTEDERDAFHREKGRGVGDSTYREVMRWVKEYRSTTRGKTQNEYRRGNPRGSNKRKSR